MNTSQTVRTRAPSGSSDADAICKYFFINLTLKVKGIDIDMNIKPQKNIKLLTEEVIKKKHGFGGMR